MSDVVNRTTGYRSRLNVDDTENLLIKGVEVDNFVWDPVGLAWVRETQPGGGGGGGGTSSSFGAAFPATGTAVGFKDVSNNMAAGLLDASGNLKVNVAAGGAGGGIVQQGARDATAQNWLTDPSDRAARLLGHVTIDNATLAVTQSTSPWVTDPNDRA